MTYGEALVFDLRENLLLDIDPKSTTKLTHVAEVTKATAEKFKKKLLCAHMDMKLGDHQFKLLGWGHRLKGQIGMKRKLPATPEISSIIGEYAKKKQK